jgi:shikimate dehydrogenase
MEVNAKTALYGIIGHPIRHSLSPLIQNLAFAYWGINAVYLAFDVKDLKSALKGVRALNIKGLSITIPHKTNIIPLLDKIDSTAQEIRAVNTVINKDGHLLGFNTDWLGVVLALKEKTQVANKRFIILGAGGAARAAAFGLKKEGAEIIIINRTYAKGASLAKEIQAKAFAWEKLVELKADVLINTTPIGMWPEVNTSPIDDNIAARFRVIMDLIYNPLETKLLQMAKKAGCLTIDGLKMLIYQGAEQFSLWTKRKAPLEKMTEVAQKELEKEKKYEKNYHPSSSRHKN